MAEKELDPEPFECGSSWDGSIRRHAREHEGYVHFNPRPEYEQDSTKYPESTWEYSD